MNKNTRRTYKFYGSCVYWQNGNVSGFENKLLKRFKENDESLWLCEVCFSLVIYVFYNKFRVKTGLTKTVINLGQMNKFWKIFPRPTCLPSSLFCSFCHLKYTNSVLLHFLETNDKTPQGCAEGWLGGWRFVTWGYALGGTSQTM